MQPDPSFSPQRGYAPSRRGRSVAFGLALATSLGLLALLVLMGRFDVPGGAGAARLVAVNLSGDRAEKQPAAKAEKAKPVTKTVAQAAVVPKVPPRVEVPAERHYELPPGFIRMSRADLAAADIGKMPQKAAGGAGTDAGAAGGGGGEGQGEGPGGARLYNAEWYREPSNAELAGYMPPGRSPGEWAMIACRTVEKFHVEDCQEMGESPRGSGMARALREAAWQFLVRPPRIDGKPVIGAWVRIRFDFSKGRPSGAG
ncbi:MAG: hypothetical protein RIS94_2652 [Pseudomonadota bacterium]|jgi:protein TonB